MTNLRPTLFSRALALGIALSMIGPFGLGQEIAEQTFEESTRIYVVEVPVRVLLKGEPLRGLGREDFQVLDQGEPRQITNFEIINIETSICASKDNGKCTAIWSPSKSALNPAHTIG